MPVSLVRAAIFGASLAVASPALGQTQTAPPTTAPTAPVAAAPAVTAAPVAATPAPAMPAASPAAPQAPSTPTAVAPPPVATAPVPSVVVAATPNDYANPMNWLCLPGHKGACDASLDTTVVGADGSTTIEKYARAKKPAIDCFYVYPTVSRDPGVISSMSAEHEELSVVAVQFARFGAVCRQFAPLYRQFTLTALAARLAGKPMAATGIDPRIGYNDVVDAWNYYLAHYNKGRGVVLIGHSQGSGVLTQLIKNEIDGKPIQKQLLSAILMGTRLQVPVGAVVGGDFKAVPLCAASAQIGCAIAYASFRATSPPAATSLFGKSAGPGLEAACVNPAALGGGSGDVHAYLGNTSLIVQSTTPMAWVKGKTITTPFVSVPGLITAECRKNDAATYLAISFHGDPAGPRTTDIRGDVVVGGQVLPDWGLHLIDANLFMGNLIDIVRDETKTYESSTH